MVCARSELYETSKDPLKLICVDGFLVNKMLTWSCFHPLGERRQERMVSYHAS